MRKLIYGINLTLDGCCDHTKGIADEELHNYYTQLLLECDTFLYGRKTYELMVPFWPEMAKHNSGETKALNDFAHAFAAVRQMIVVSRSLTQPEQQNTKLVRDNLRDEVTKLKQQEGKSIMTGGVDIPSQLIELGLIDEYYVVIQPKLAGEGRRLFDKSPIAQMLKLIDSKVLASGSVALRYGNAS